MEIVKFKGLNTGPKYNFSAEAVCILLVVNVKAEQEAALPCVCAAEQEAGEEAAAFTS